MEIRLPKEKILKTYQRYSLPVAAQEPVDVKKMEFFYVGTKVRHIEKLTGFFEFGYSTTSTDHAMITLKRLLKKTEDVTIPGMILAEAGIGIEKLAELHRFTSSYKILADMPFIVEATGLSRAAVTELKRCPFIDEVLFLTEFTAPELQRKVTFLKRVKQKWVNQPTACAVETSFPMFSDVPSFFKRTLDIIISASLLLLLSPVLALIALTIRLESNGPILVGSKRVGRGYNIFDLLRFRTITLIEDPTTQEGQSTQCHAMLTKVGLFLRKTGLDDLPQLLNVLIGDLSLVGHRPLLLHEAAKMTTNEWAKRFLAPAGITGWWQFRKSSQEVLLVDECATDNMLTDQPELLYDLWAMANTPPAIIQKTNA